MKKIALASDFDNTLHFTTNGVGYIKDIDRQAVTRFRRHGNLFGTCSGRPLDSLLLQTRDNINLDFHIVSTGSLICEDDETCTVLHEDTLDADVVYDLIQENKDTTDFYIHADGTVFSFARYRYNYPTQVVLSRKEELYGKHITGISGHCATDLVSAKVVERLNEQYPEVSAYQNVDWIDVVPHGVSKGSGLLKLKEIKGIDIIGAIGDARNDIPSLKAADISFTFDYAPDDVKAIADHIVDSVADAIEIMEKMR